MPAKTVNKQDVIKAFEVILGRKPESPQAIAHHLGAVSHVDLVAGILASAEANARISFLRQSPFFHYNTSVDVRGIIENNIDHERKPREGHNVNFLGVAVPIEVFDFLADTGGTLDEVPLPSNYHADMAEWAAAIRPIDLANKRFTMIELGSGWGCWMVNTGVVAKKRGLSVDLVGVEGDPKHVSLCHKTMASNGILPSEYSIVRGVASAASGVALFPKRQPDESNWGFEPIFNATESMEQELVSSGAYEALEMIPLHEVIGDRTLVDLLHLDIQGGEVDVIRGTLDILKEKVGYILIGTHSRVIEGELIGILQSEGWVLEIERPAIFLVSTDGTLQTAVDGVQGWRNPKFHQG